MQLIRNKENLEGFQAVCEKYEKYDARYLQRQLQDEIFTNDFIECAYIVFLIMKQSEEEAAAKKAFNLWRNFCCENPTNLAVFFQYVDQLFSDAVTHVWHKEWDSKDRNIAKEREMICRIFILNGITVQEKFYRSGALT